MVLRYRAVGSAIPEYADPVSTRNSKSFPFTRTGTSRTPPWARRPATRLARGKTDRQSCGDRIAGEEDEHARVGVACTEVTRHLVQRTAVRRVRDDIAFEWHVSAVDSGHSHRDPFTGVSSARRFDVHGTKRTGFPTQPSTKREDSWIVFSGTIDAVPVLALVRLPCWGVRRFPEFGASRAFGHKASVAQAANSALAGGRHHEGLAGVFCYWVE